jgi:manganese/zinc/iron transport system substrate-binding protein
MHFKHLVFFLTATLIFLISFYFFLVQQTPTNQNCKPRIVCTTTIIADAIKNIALNTTIDLKVLMGPGVDPHTYKPIEQDIITIAQADIIFYHGLHLEARMADIFAQLHNIKKTVAVTESIPKDQLIYSKDFSTFPDPHVWFDPELWIFAVQTITKNLQTLMPENYELYEKNKNEFIKKIQATYQTTQKMILKIPREQRFLITGHDAFSYFARAYDCKVISLQGISTASEAGTCDVQNLINFIVHHKIPTIFSESCIPTRSMQALIQGATSQGWSVKLGRELFSDALGSPNTLPGTYLGMVEYNVESMIQGVY